MRIATFEISRAHGGFDVFDKDEFNNWGSALGFVTLRDAVTYAAHADQFKRGRTFLSCWEWAKGFGAQACIAALMARASHEVKP